jgi:hypothetical protein
MRGGKRSTWDVRYILVEKMETSITGSYSNFTKITSYAE